MNAENGTEAMWIGFIGHCLQESTEAVHAFEDAVLALLPRYGAAVIIRGQRHEREPAELPAEIHILYFPSRHAYQAFLDDPDRLKLVETFGPIFSDKTIVELAPPLLGRPSQEDQ